MRKRRWLGVVAAAASAVLVAGCGGGGSVQEWVAATAAPLVTADPRAPLDDLGPLRAAVGGAGVGGAGVGGVEVGGVEVVGLGESVHGAADELTLKHRALRVLVEQAGFRSVAWEEDWTTGRRIDEYVTTGVGDADELVRAMSPQWQSREVADVLRWLREVNAGRTDKVRFVGVEYYLTGQGAYDALDAYVAAAAPQRLAELREHLRLLRPASADVFEHIQSLAAVPDKQSYVRAARAVYDLVSGLPTATGDEEQTARQIVSFYEHVALPEDESHAYRDARAAENLERWRARTDHKIAYWAASPHTANASALRISSPEGQIRFRSVGSHLRERLGTRYLSIGFTFGRGSVSAGGGQAVPLPAADEGWFEHPLGLAGHERFLLDLRAPAPPVVREWLDAPITTRGPNGPGSITDGGTAAAWFDVIVHSRVVGPAAG
ncbi:erythromycin esterase family protein [Actinomycetes bacterium KLBMP 9759]